MVIFLPRKENNHIVPEKLLSSLKFQVSYVEDNNVNTKFVKAILTDAKCPETGTDNTDTDNHHSLVNHVILNSSHETIVSHVARRVPYSNSGVPAW